MKKVKALFVVERSVQMATREIEPTAQWVFDGEGEATIKYDGTPVLIKNGKLYKRWNRKLQKKFLKQWRYNKENFKYSMDMFVDIPEGAIALEDAPAPISLHFPYWIPVIDEKSNKRFIRAFDDLESKDDGTYELVGETIQGNIYNLEGNKLLKHGSEIVSIPDMSFDGIKQFFKELNAEGIVWHHPDGRMIKLRRSHFNFEWREDIRNCPEQRKNFIA